MDVAGTFSDDSAIDELDTADYAFGDPENETNATVEVFDAYNGGAAVSLGTLDAADFDEDETATFNPASRTFTHPGGFDCTPYQVSNTATVESGEVVLDSDTETVDVTLECARQAGETATGFGPKWSLTRNAPATWFMYTTWADILDGGADIIAGQFMDIGTITGSRNGTTSLTIDLDAGWYFANVSNNVKINPMSCSD